MPIAEQTNASVQGFGENPRLAMIDIAKGLGILLIVLGHNQSFAIHQSDWAGFLSSFRLPFFFFMSGVTFSVADRSWTNVAISRADAWLKPFAVVTILSGLLNLMSGKATGESILLALVFGTGFTLVWSAIWFLPHLWLLYVSTTALLIHGKKLIDSWPKRIALLFFLSTAGYFFMQLFHTVQEDPSCRLKMHFDWSVFDCGLPLSADLLMLTAIYFLLGHFVARYIKSFRLNAVAMVICVGLVISLYLTFWFRIDLNMRRYDDLILSTLQALCGIYMMLCVCHLLTRHGTISRVFIYVGQASLFILLFHMPIQNRITNFLSPRIHNELITCLTGFFISIAVAVFLWEVAKRNKWLALLLLPAKKKPLVPTETVALTAPTNRGI
jgi:fucose 4-O-acetylase-like acetyltransferase